MVNSLTISDTDFAFSIMSFLVSFCLSLHFICDLNSIASSTISPITLGNFVFFLRCDSPDKIDIFFVCFSLSCSMFSLKSFIFQVKFPPSTLYTGSLIINLNSFFPSKSKILLTVLFRFAQLRNLHISAFHSFPKIEVFPNNPFGFENV